MSLSNSSQLLSLDGPFGLPIHRFTYDDDWHPTTDGDGPSLVVVDPTAPLESWAEATSWRASLEAGGSPGRADGVANGSQLPGDVNQDSRLDLADAVATRGYLFQGGSAPCFSEEANTTLLNTNGDPSVDLADAIYTLNHLFDGGSPPVLGTDCLNIAGCPDRCP